MNVILSSTFSWVINSCFDTCRSLDARIEYIFIRKTIYSRHDKIPYETKGIYIILAKGNNIAGDVVGYLVPYMTNRLDLLS